ncbi:hypothetical protein [uncultured Sphingomonas sp.]|uniref:magnesium chelatase subunit ChlI family protein n=1 Tax=uncultured Sphingomonas sp. TaxID=158754 RepID=UPI00338F694B
MARGAARGFPTWIDVTVAHVRTHTTRGADDRGRSRTIADLAGAEAVGRIHVAEALGCRRQPPRN